jgi:hypothetical protein
MDEFTNFDFQGLVKADRMHGRFKIKYKPDSMNTSFAPLY